MRDYVKGLAPALIATFGAVASASAVIYASFNIRWLNMLSLAVTVIVFICMVLAVGYGFKVAREEDEERNTLV